jgi:hypothetical protein
LDRLTGCAKQAKQHAWCLWISIISRPACLLRCSN